MIGRPRQRRALCISPRYAPSFGTFTRAYPIMGAKAFMPPLGILVIASYLPSSWEVRFIDENIREVSDAELRWAEVVLLSGMHVQRQEIGRLVARAKAAGRTTVLGGASASGAPDWYPQIDYLHIGELGDATDRLIATLEADPAPPRRQVRFETTVRRDLDAFPTPAWQHIRTKDYFIAALQYSSGCPYRCEFCDIPALYGRVPRLKRPEQVLAELDALLERGVPGAVYFVDDNFVGNRKAARDLLPHLIDWQRRNGFPLQFACEATLNLARDDDLLALMREAFFCTVFCGIETPEPAALAAIAKEHNLAVPMLDAVAKCNSYGIEVVAGIILGFDTDGPKTVDALIEFAERSHIPMLTVNLLEALPRTPLWHRLAADDRIDDAPGRESNVVFLRPYEEVLAGWRRAFGTLYRPEALWDRLAWNAANTYPNRITPPMGGPHRSWRDLGFFLRLVVNLFVRVGLLAPWRREFWRHAWPLIRRGLVREGLHMAMLAHHLIGYANDAASGRAAAAFYAAGARPEEPAKRTASDASMA
ncbi:MAG TPA: B12-binding domain-containing radical SAM protein [Stellaceae bacterium]|nr:B12-binding domain-containing radical SAM protein [Stellaceae bacterium]